MTHWSHRFGITLNIASYLAQATMILWGPPPVKALGVAWASFPGADPMTYALGYYLARDWGHAAASSLQAESSQISMRMITGYCNPDDPPWYC